jgi:hypothetical protein
LIEAIARGRRWLDELIRLLAWVERRKAARMGAGHPQNELQNKSDHFRWKFVGASGRGCI